MYFSSTKITVCARKRNWKSIPCCKWKRLIQKVTNNSCHSRSIRHHKLKEKWAIWQVGVTAKWRILIITNQAADNTTTITKEFFRNYFCDKFGRILDDLCIRFHTFSSVSNFLVPSSLRGPRYLYQFPISSSRNNGHVNLIRNPPFPVRAFQQTRCIGDNKARYYAQQQFDNTRGIRVKRVGIAWGGRGGGRPTLTQWLLNF